MKVALIVFGIKARRVGGIEVWCHETVRRLAEDGWRIVLCFDGEPAPEVRQYLSRPEVIWETLPDASRSNPQTLRGLARIIRRYRPALLHLQFTPFLSLNAWLAKLLGVRRILFTDHGSHPAGFVAVRQPLLKRMAGRFLNAPVNYAIPVSDYNRGVLATLGTINPAQLQRIYNGIDLVRCGAPPTGSAEAFRERHGIPADRILVTQVSSINAEKGVPDLVEAARLALAEAPLLHFAIVGDGKHRAEYERLAEKAGIADHVTFTGLVKDPMAEGVYSSTDIGCQASRWQEAFGLVIAEAMAFGKPVVATRVGGIPELVTDGQTGFLVPDANPAALAEKLVLLARDGELRKRLGHAGRVRAERDFDVRRNVDQLMKLYGIR